MKSNNLYKGNVLDLLLNCTQFFLLGYGTLYDSR